MSPLGSTVNTLEKNFPKMSAFSLSLFVNLDLSSCGLIFQSDTHSRVLVFEFIYFQTAFGFDLASIANFNSYCF